MTITKDAWMRYIYTVIMSTIIHAICHLLFGDGRIEFFSLLTSIMLGVNIWFLAEALFTLTQRIWTRNVLPSYMVLLAVVGIGTFLGGYALGVTAVYMMVIICVSAEIAAFLLVFLYRRHYKKLLNRKLVAFQKMDEKES